MRRARQSKEQGAALVEFAFVMIPLFLLIFGIIVFGHRRPPGRAAHHE